MSGSYIRPECLSYGESISPKVVLHFFFYKSYLRLSHSASNSVKEGLLLTLLTVSEKVSISLVTISEGLQLIAERWARIDRSYLEKFFVRIINVVYKSQINCFNTSPKVP